MPSDGLPGERHAHHRTVLEWGEDNLLDGARPGGQIYGYITGGNPNDSGNFVSGFSNGGGADRGTGDQTLRTGSPAYTVGAYENGTRWQAGFSRTGCDLG